MNPPQVELRSGTWDAYVITMSTNGQVTGAHVGYVQDSGSQRMHALTGPDPSTEELAAAARNPREREMLKGDQRWRFYPIPSPPFLQADPKEIEPAESVVFSSGGGGGRGELPPGVTLGTATGEELEKLIRDNRHW